MRKLILKLSVGFLTLFLFGCPAGMPVWNGKIYIGDATDQSIKRAQDVENAEIIYTNDPRFNNFYCVSDTDLADLIRILHSCKSWKKDK